MSTKHPNDESGSYPISLWPGNTWENPVYSHPSQIKLSGMRCFLCKCVIISSAHLIYRNTTEKAADSAAYTQWIGHNEPEPADASSIGPIPAWFWHITASLQDARDTPNQLIINLLNDKWMRHLTDLWNKKVISLLWPLPLIEMRFCAYYGIKLDHAWNLMNSNEKNGRSPIYHLMTWHRKKHQTITYTNGDGVHYCIKRPQAFALGPLLLTWINFDPSMDI